MTEGSPAAPGVTLGRRRGRPGQRLLRVTVAQMYRESAGAVGRMLLQAPVRARTVHVLNSAPPRRRSPARP